jgi:hypothetical protein
MSIDVILTFLALARVQMSNDVVKIATRQNPMISYGTVVYIFILLLRCDTLTHQTLSCQQLDPLSERMAIYSKNFK